MEFLFNFFVENVFVVVALSLMGLALALHREPKRPRRGPGSTEKAARDAGCVPSDSDYDAKMRSLWGGPPPKHFQKCWEEWPEREGFQAPEDRRSVALVTGGTGGIGFYVAKMLAHLGYEVILPARTGFEEEASGAAAAIQRAVPSAKIVVPSAKLDLDSLESVRNFSKCVRYLDGLSSAGLSLLCLNAGRGGSKGDAREETADGIEAIMHVNVMGHFLLVAQLLPLLCAAPRSRVVSQSSMARLCNAPGFKNMEYRIAKLADLGGTDSSCFNAFHQYALSKACNCFFTQALNDRLLKANMSTVNALVCDPGFASTGVNVQHNLGHSFLPLPDGWLTTKTMHSVGGAQHAADGALPMVLACCDPDAGRGDWYTPQKQMGGPPVKRHPGSHKDAATDPINELSMWPAESREVFWRQAMRSTNANWGDSF
eukprot:TRINITY_DN64408_c0_g1_i1.p1 TRINITY_DN64408_c0_g1~~TRINITY_DN64408_c0_g1_i1.p1  ORF type:complete len:469 (-),score=59.84 TRINITY_DN64408_c0_g1_i1:193-1476(-)